MANLDWVLHQHEGQFFERKGCWDRSGDTPKRRNVREVAKDVAETLTAMANADGGALVLGIEDDGMVTGLDYPGDRLDVLRRAPQTLVNPPLRPRLQEDALRGMSIMVFEVDASAGAHQLTDGRYLLRVGDQNLPFPAHDIEAMKEAGRRRVTEGRFVSEASLSDINLSLVTELAGKTGLNDEPVDVLIRYRLAERRNGSVALTLAALLLFGNDPGKWHPRCGIDFVKYEGTERRLGAALNIIKRERIEAPLPHLIEEIYRAIQPHVKERQQLVDLFFEERMEYPPFAWQEAIVNAVAHRDYRYEGMSIEVWMFDDRMEIRSPGELIEPITLERLQKRERIHASRNPRIVRVLTDFGYMREQGEGIPRMFDVMERQGMYPPELRMEAGAIFTVVLRSQPVYSLETMRWLKQFETLDLNPNQKRLLAYAREHDMSFTSRAYQDLAHIDLYSASRDIRELAYKGLARLQRKGARTYELVVGQAKPKELPAEYLALRDTLAAKGFITNADIRVTLGVSLRRAGTIAKWLVENGWLKAVGERRGRRYFPGG
jgi:ATP-dependent DNA helicase RecG